MCVAGKEGARRPRLKQVDSAKSIGLRMMKDRHMFSSMSINMYIQQYPYKWIYSKVKFVVFLKPCQKYNYFILLFPHPDCSQLKKKTGKRMLKKRCQLLLLTVHDKHFLYDGNF